MVYCFPPNIKYFLRQKKKKQPQQQFFAILDFARFSQKGQMFSTLSIPLQTMR